MGDVRIMARPFKNTVDYFPHSCNHKKTMFILESKFGNNGYAFWFKLLEILGSSDNHVYDYNNPHDWEFMLAKTKVTNEQAQNILQTLANIDAIDKELFEKNVIWSQNFVDNVADVYNRRKQEIPKKPIVADNNIVIDDNNLNNDSNNRQSKVKESIVNKSKENKSKILKVLKRENQKYGLIKISSEKKWNKIYELCLVRFKEGYTLLDICHAQRGMYKIKESSKTWWNRKKDLIELLTRGQGKTSNMWIWLDEFKDAHFNQIEDTRFELTKKPKNSRWF